MLLSCQKSALILPKNVGLKQRSSSGSVLSRLLRVLRVDVDHDLDTLPACLDTCLVGKDMGSELRAACGKVLGFEVAGNGRQSLGDTRHRFQVEDASGVRSPSGSWVQSGKLCVTQNAKCCGSSDADENVRLSWVKGQVGQGRSRVNMVLTNRFNLELRQMCRDLVSGV
eukprot:6488912-Amphidinium_carterae.1